jgi:hypothetical protein
MKRTVTQIEPHQGAVETRCSFLNAYHFVNAANTITLETSAGTAFTAKAVDSMHGKVIRFYQRGKEYGRAYQCCWGHYYNCNRTRIGMYCSALDHAARGWFSRKVAELKAGMDDLPTDRQEQLKREMEKEIED